MSSLEIMNPFFTDETTRVYELPILPFMSAGDAAQLQAAADLGVWLNEVGYVGSDETVARAAATFAQFQEVLPEVGEVMGIEANVGALDHQPPAPRELVLGTAMLYAWEEPDIEDFGTLDT